MSYNLFLDDVRSVKMVYPQMMEADFIIVRDYGVFVTTILQKGLPSFISFDNDLGLNSKGNVAKDGYDCAKWLVYQSNLDLRTLRFKVYLANPIAKIQIQSLLNNYINHLINL